MLKYKLWHTLFSQVIGAVSKFDFGTAPFLIRHRETTE